METWFRALADVAYAIVAAWGVIGVTLVVVALIGLVLLVASWLKRRRAGRRPS
jgi:hypothetical protein